MYYGKYRGVVKDTNDPEKRGRIRVMCPAVLGKQLSNWALPCLPPNCFSVPIKDTMVWVEFEGGRKDSPIWTGVFYTTDQRKLLFQDAYIQSVDPRLLYSDYPRCSSTFRQTECYFESLPSVSHFEYIGGQVSDNHGLI